MKKILFLAIALLAVGLTVFTACSGKKESGTESGTTSTATSSQSSGRSSAEMEVTAEAKALLEKYGLTAETLKPSNATRADTGNSGEEEVIFFYPEDAEPNRKENYTRMCEAFIASADDGKIWLYFGGKVDMEFDMKEQIDNTSSMQQFAWVYKGNTYRIRLHQTGSRFSTPAYYIEFEQL